ncbi:AMP-binding protein [Streptomyces afghaniensis]|uniref:AMP-binding protein n=1 Tax=Streptomyces afghaniensis TaxID=66865 RepID=UPI000412D0D0|nr:AMP-binding protein [Streptomyces afghaniensis]
MERIRHHAAHTPHAIAVTDDHQSLTYAELAGRASRLTRELLTAGITPDDRVVYHGQRGTTALITLLGILGAGGAYVPLNLRTPHTRQADMVVASGARYIVAEPDRTAEAAVTAAAAGRTWPCSPVRTRPMGWTIWCRCEAQATTWPTSSTPPDPPAGPRAPWSTEPE